MSDDEKLAAEEARRAGQHGAVRSHIAREVGAEIAAARVSQFVDYVFYVIYALLAVRIGLALMAGNPEAGFYRFIRAVTAPFYAPFRGIVESPTDPSGHTLLLPLVVAIVAYALLHLAINGILRMMARRKTEI